MRSSGKIARPAFAAECMAAGSGTVKEAPSRFISPPRALRLTLDGGGRASSRGPPPHRGAATPDRLPPPSSTASPSWRSEAAARRSRAPSKATFRRCSHPRASDRRRRHLPPRLSPTRTRLCSRRRGTSSRRAGGGGGGSRLGVESGVQRLGRERLRVDLGGGRRQRRRTRRRILRSVRLPGMLVAGLADGVELHEAIRRAAGIEGQGERHGRGRAAHRRPVPP